MTRTFFPTFLVLVLATACGPSGHARSYAKPTPDQLIAHLSKLQSQARSFEAESRMEYWANGERVKPTVLIMGERGAKVRLNALNPTGDDVAADLACDGTNFQLVDFNNNCQLTGPCTRDAISRLLRVSLEPDDFLLMAVGSTPIVDRPKGTLEWDAKNGHEIISLTSGDGLQRQQIVVDGRDKRWDVLSSTVWDAQGNIEWKLENKDFEQLKARDGTVFRVPSRTRLDQPKAKAQLSVRWIERAVNHALDPSKFTMEIPAGLPRCGGEPAAQK